MNPLPSGDDLGAEIPALVEILELQRQTTEMLTPLVLSQMMKNRRESGTRLVTAPVTDINDLSNLPRRRSSQQPPAGAPALPTAYNSDPLGDLLRNVNTRRTSADALLAELSQRRSSNSQRMPSIEQQQYQQLPHHHHHPQQQYSQQQQQYYAQEPHQVPPQTQQVYAPSQVHRPQAILPPTRTSPTGAIPSRRSPNSTSAFSNIPSTNSSQLQVPFTQSSLPNPFNSSSTAPQTPTSASNLLAAFSSPRTSLTAPSSVSPPNVVQANPNNSTILRPLKRRRTAQGEYIDEEAQPPVQIEQQKASTETQKEALSEVEKLKKELQELKQKNQQLEQQNAALTKKVKLYKGENLETISHTELCDLYQELSTTHAACLKLLKLHKEEEKNDKEGMQCVVCMANRKNVLFSPCMHVVQCEKCPLPKNCSVCKKGVDFTAKVYV